MSKKLLPFNDVIIAERIIQEEKQTEAKTTSGIIMVQATSNNQKPQFSTVLAIGPDVKFGRISYW